MPTIEIVSLKSAGLDLNQDYFNSAIIEDHILESHRGLFYDFLLKHKGTIIHIGNPGLSVKEDGFYAGEIINWEFENSNSNEKQKELKTDEENHWANQDFLFQLKDEYKNEIEKLMEVAIEKSPIHKIYFLTDYQFGPEKAEFEVLSDVKDFWKKHNQYGLNWNTLYEISIKE